MVPVGKEAGCAEGLSAGRILGWLVGRRSASPAPPPASSWYIKAEPLDYL